MPCAAIGYRQPCAGFCSFGLNADPVSDRFRVMDPSEEMSPPRHVAALAWDVLPSILAVFPFTVCIDKEFPIQLIPFVKLMTCRAKFGLFKELFGDKSIMGTMFFAADLRYPIPGFNFRRSQRFGLPLHGIPGNLPLMTEAFYQT